MKFIPSVIMLILMFSAAYAQTEQLYNALPRVEGRFVEKGTNQGLAGLTVELYCNNNKTPDITTTNSNGEINKEVTDVETETTTETIGTITATTPNGKITGINNIDNAIIYNPIAQKAENITTEIQKGNTLAQIIKENNLANGIYFIKAKEGTKIYDLKIIYIDGQILGANTIPITQKKIIKKFPKNTGTTTLDSVIAYSNNVAKTVFKNFQPFQDSINIGTKELELQGYTYHTITTYGVDSDSGTTTKIIPNAKLKIRRHYSINDTTTYYGTTNAEGYGIIRTKLPGTTADTLYIEKKGYTLRTEFIDTRTNTNTKTYSITDSVDIYFFETVFLRNNEVYPLAKPDSSFGDTLTFWGIENAPNQMWYDYTKDAIENGIAKFTGGKCHGKIVSDSTGVYGKILWDPNIIGNGEIGIYRKPGDWSTIQHVEIKFMPFTDPFPWVEPAIADVTKKEIGNAVYGQGDIQTPNVPESWQHESMWYNPLTAPTEVHPNWTQWDINFGVIAGKLPQGYIINVIHNPRPQ
jgi:hypothetical protein